MKRKVYLIETNCKRCGKPLVTMNRSVYGLDYLKDKYGEICHACMTDDERNQMLQEMGQGILRRIS